MRSQQECPASAADAVVTVTRRRQSPVDLAEPRFRESTHPALRGVCCSFHEGVLTLRGRVSSFYQVQLALALATQTPGVEEVVNHIQVKERAPC